MCACALLISSYLGVVRGGWCNVHGGYGHHHRRHRDRTATATAITRFLGSVWPWRIVGEQTVGVEARDALTRFKVLVVGLQIAKHGICNQYKPIRELETGRIAVGKENWCYLLVNVNVRAKPLSPTLTFVSRIENLQLGSMSIHVSDI